MHLAWGAASGSIVSGFMAMMGGKGCLNIGAYMSTMSVVLLFETQNINHRLRKLYLPEASNTLLFMCLIFGPSARYASQAFNN